MMGFPSPRDFQQRAHEALRGGVRDGHRCQVLMAPTGGGKTYLGLRIAKEAIDKGKRVVFVCDRTTLINQTSETSDRYGLTDHGIIQSDHWRTKPQHLFQIASAQTLARRKWPKADVIIVDECHTQHTAWTSHIKTTQAVVIGLSATPFSPGLGKLFSQVVNAATMR
jgi:superfamily II DNA or RNA helicase